MNSVALQKNYKYSLLGEGLLKLRSQQQRWPMVLCFLILSAAVFSGPLDIAEGSDGDMQSRFAKTPSVMFKLATALGAAAIGVWGVVCVPRVRQLLTTTPGLMLCTTAMVFLATCATSITSASVPIALIFSGYLVFIPTCLIVLGLRGTLLAALWGVLLFTLGAFFLYFFVPRYGVFPEDFGNGVLVERMGGMSQPNHTGRSAMVGFLISAYFFRLPRAPRTLCVLLMGLFLLAGLLAMSRTALIAGFVCLMVLNLDRVLSRAGLVAVTTLLLAIAAGLFALTASGREEELAEKILGAATKTGEIEELTTVTGRAEIWERTIDLIKGRPLQGYGLGSNKIMLVDHLQSTHNILLHPTLAAGVIAGGLTLVLLLWNLLTALISPQLVIRALCVYVLLSGLSEDTIYETFPGACTLVWLTCCLWPMVQTGEE